MNDKPTIVFVIDNLKRGGAETLLVGILPAISKHYQIVLVTLTAHNHFTAAEMQYCQHISLGFSGKLSYPGTVRKLKKILAQYKPVLLHVHLTLSSQIARLAARGRYKIIISLHSMLYSNIFSNSTILLWIEKWLFKPSHILLAVSRPALEEYEQYIGKAQQSFVLPNYVGNDFLHIATATAANENNSQLRLVAVGNIRRVKNYDYVLQALALLPAGQVSLDIYGAGEEDYIQELKKYVQQHVLSVAFKGPCSAVHKILPGYDAFIMASRHEGFGIAVIEAMACGLPLLLSNIDVFKQIAMDNALYFELNNPAQLAQLMMDTFANKSLLKQKAAMAVERVHQVYSRDKYEQNLLALYAGIAQQKD